MAEKRQWLGKRCQRCFQKRTSNRLYTPERNEDVAVNIIDNSGVESEVFNSFLLDFEVDKLNPPLGKKERMAYKHNKKEKSDTVSMKSERSNAYKLIPELRELQKQEMKEKSGLHSDVIETKSKEKKNLDEMADDILERVHIVLHNGNLHFYNGKSYTCIQDKDDLLALVRSCVSRDAFGLSRLVQFQDLVNYLKADERLIPNDYEERLEESRDYVVFRNGLLNLRTLELYEHSPWYLTFHELNVRWNPNAEAPEFEKFLKKVSGKDPEIMLRLKETMGYLLTPLNCAKAFFIMGPAPDSGKSQLGLLLQKLLGDQYVTGLSSHQIDGRFALGGTSGKLLNLGMDLPHGRINHIVAAMLKMITGGDVITIEEKFQKPRKVQSGLRFLFASNYPVTVQKEVGDEAFWNRMVILPFLYSVAPDEMDKELLMKLYEEKEGIIYKCLTALQGVIQNNYQFSYCEAAEKLKQQWRYGNDNGDGYETLLQYIKAQLDITGNSEDRLMAKDLYEDYSNFCKQQARSCICYNDWFAWMKENLDGCEHDRIRFEPKGNAKSGFKGVKFKV